MKNADKTACEVLYKPESDKYDEDIRVFQGFPTVAVTEGGRIYLGWYAGGTGEPHMENYNLLIYSDDSRSTWSKPIIVIPSSYENHVHALDIQLFTDPRGALHVAWVQNNAYKFRGEEPEKKNFSLSLYGMVGFFPICSTANGKLLAKIPMQTCPCSAALGFYFTDFCAVSPHS